MPNDLDLTEAVEAAAARLYVTEHGTTSAISAAAMFAALAESAPPLARHYLDRARFQVEAAAPLIEQAVRERVANDIEARRLQLDPGDVWENEGRGYLAEAVAIARGETTEADAKAVDHE